jgi:DNA-binding MltR family transcriptional regulator
MSNFPPKTKEEARAFIRSIMGPPKRTIEGQEYDDIMLLIKLTQPFHSSNNQHTMTDEYRIAGKLYHVTYLPSANKPEIEEIKEE